MNRIVDGPYYQKANDCEAVLRALPDWFGIEDAIVQYVREMDDLPTFLAQGEGQIVGFLSVKLHNPYAAEVYVMGVRIAAHRQGTGRALMNAAEAWLKEQGVEYLQVKTLGASHSDPSYAGTRQFYQAVGFRPLEEFRQIWDEHNPCLVMVKKL